MMPLLVRMPGGVPVPERGGGGQQAHALAVVGVGPHPPVEVRHGLHVVVQHVRPGLQHGLQGGGAAAEIRDQHLHPAPGLRVRIHWMVAAKCSAPPVRPDRPG